MRASVRRCVSCPGLTPHTLAPGCVSASTAVDGRQWAPLPKPAQAEEEAMCPPHAHEAHMMRCTQPAPHSIVHFWFSCGCWTTRIQGVIAMTIPMPVALEVRPKIGPGSVPGALMLFPFCDGTQWAATPVLAPLPPSWSGTFYFFLIHTVILPQNVLSPFYCCSSSQFMLLRAFLGKSADHASTLWISLLSLWFNTNIIFCDQMCDASLSPKARLYPFKPRNMNFTTVKRQRKGE